MAFGSLWRDYIIIEANIPVACSDDHRLATIDMDVDSRIAKLARNGWDKRTQFVLTIDEDSKRWTYCLETITITSDESGVVRCGLNFVFTAEYAMTA